MYCPAEPVRRRRLALLVFATTVVAGLGTAGQALATELPAPPPMPEVELAVPEPPETSVPMPAMPDLDLEPVVETQIDAENVDVSVRVLSPGEDAPVTQEGAADVVSEAFEPDITAPAAAADQASDEDATPTGGTNTNISIRVLSPGDRGAVTQSAGQATGGSGEEVVEADPGSALPDPAPASTAQPDELSDPSQYQSDNSRYQSGSTSAADSWNWLWVLSLDCSGNASSTSTESGRQESLVWSWEWVWEWGCSGTETSGSSAETEARASPPDTVEQPDAASATGSPGSELAGTEPWVWSWTFTFCGETRTISTTGGTGTPLTWTWDWTWTWTCPTAAAPDVQAPPAVDMSPPLVTVPPAASGAGDFPGDAPPTPQAFDGAAAVVLPTVWFAAFPFGVAAGAPIQAVVPPLPISTTDLEIELEVAISPVVLPVSTAPPLPSAAIPFPAVDVAAEPTTLPAPRRTITPRTRPSVVHPAEAHVPPSHSEPGTHHARPVEETRAQGRRPKDDREQLPLERWPSRQALGSSSAGGIVPSALLFGFAALTGFIVLAAPGLGRRIRAPRKLRPSSPDQSPIEHPG